MNDSWVTTTTIARGNDTSMALTPEDNSWWRPLAIALPVCLLGIPLVTVLIIVLVTCYRSKTRHKENSAFGQKLNDETAEVENEVEGNRTENPTSLSPVYANLSETVEEAMATSTSNGTAKNPYWSLKMPWKKRQNAEAMSKTANTEVEKNPATNHRKRREGEAEKETGMMDEERNIGKGVGRTPGGLSIEVVGVGSLSGSPKVNGKALTPYGVPMRQKNVMTTQNQNTDNTTTTKPSQTDNRKTFVVMYSRDSNEPDYLSLYVNEVIYSLDEEKDGWMKGEKKESGEIGWFPRNHVREGMSPLKKRHSMHEKAEASSSSSSDINHKTSATGARTTLATMTTTTQPSDDDIDAFEDFDDEDDDDDDYETGIECKALYPYRATEDGDINFDAGDVIVVVEKQDNGWWRGYHGDDHGFFPGSYVQQTLRTDELSQPLVSTSQDAGDSIGAADDTGHLDDPEMLMTVAEEDEDDDDGDTLQQKQNKRKTKSARKSIGDFLKHLPRRITSSNRTGNDAGDHGGSPVVTSDPSDPMKTKKADRVVIPAFAKKKNKNKRIKNARNLKPMTRRLSLAPLPPQSGPQGAAVGTLAKNTMSGLAQMVAAEAQLRSDPLNTTYEELGTIDVLSSNRSEPDLSEDNDTLLYEIVRSLNSGDHVTDDKSFTTAAASFDFGAKRNDVSSSSQATLETYSNLDSAVQSAATAAKDIGSNRRGQETTRTEENKQERDIKNKVQSKQDSSPRKPVPPKKPRFIGSTPNIPELLKALDRRTDEGMRRSPGKKPRPMAKPGKLNSGEGRGSDLGLTGLDLSRGFPPSQKPKPLKEKPRYLSPGFPQGVVTKSDHQMSRRDIYRSLDSIKVAAEAETSDEDEAGGELEIMKWLRKKLSAEDELIGKEADVVEKGGKGPIMSGGAKELQQMQVQRTNDISDGRTQNVESKDGARTVLMFECLSKAGLNEESFV